MTDRRGPAYGVDREKVCPFLLRVFPAIGGHHRESEYDRHEPEDELRIHTWKDATLSELASLIKEVHSAARRPDSSLDFAVVYPNKRGDLVMRNIGVVSSRQSGSTDKLTLAGAGVEPGDFMDVAIM